MDRARTRAEWRILRRVLTGVAGAALTVALGGTALADPAPNNCGSSSMSVGVQFLALQSAQNITLVAGPDGTFSADVRVRVFCQHNGVDLGEVTGSHVVIVTTVPGTTANGLGATAPHYATIDLPSGVGNVHLASTDPGLAPGQVFARVGWEATVVTVAFAQHIDLDDSPVQIGRVYAATPELDSILLFGSGAVGVAGYALTRVRAKRRG